MNLLPLIARWKTVAALCLAATVAWGVRQWQPERQIRLHQQHLLQAASNRDLRKLKALLNADFHTNGGHDRQTALRQTAEILRYFFALEITGEDTQLSRNGATAEITTRLHLEGKGLPLAEAVKNQVNPSPDPFHFTWQRKSWKPWDWRLIRVSHPLISQPPPSGWFF